MKIPGHSRVAVVHVLLFILLINAVSSNSLSLEPLSESRDLGFSVDCPGQWDISSRGTAVSGNLSVEDPCSKMLISWLRDPGIGPDIILDSIEDAYDEGEVQVVSSERGQMRIGGLEAVYMDLGYEFKSSKSRKRFICWNSSASDRLFVAALSSCNWDETAPIFDVTVASFLDEGRAEQLRFYSGLDVKDRAWSILLGDLLSSYHYLDPQTLPPRSVSVRVMHLLNPENGSYRLYSSEDISADLPVAAAARAAVVLQILRKEGYNAGLLQSGGQIRLAVEDPAGAWRAVSLNPADPDREMGVLMDRASRGLAYDSIEELEEANRMDLGPIDESQMVQKDCESSRYVELKRPEKIDSAWQQELQDILQGYGYGENYQENSFDCSDTAQICCELLQSRGYDARLMMGWEGHPLGKHLWVVVSYPDEPGTYLAVETANVDGDRKLVNLGKIVEDRGYFEGIMYNSRAQFSRLHAEEGLSSNEIRLTRSG
ncbi:MAG: hypothetical protein HPY61_05170 [Methanotrichaceae archaeon]|nr:hypothetical protein [Methanotrichaceae archaeon]